MSSAQRELTLPAEYPADYPAEPETEVPAFALPAFVLKEQAAQRLAAHRARRQPAAASIKTANATAEPAAAKARSAQIAAAVAERYANSQSYRAFLAAEAEKAIREAEAASREAEAASREAEAAAEVAALSAQAVADVQYELLAELDQWSATPEPASATISAAAPAFTVKLYEEVARPLSPQPTFKQIRSGDAEDNAEDMALDDEIAFRQYPVFDDFTISAVDIPANLIEFPRQLVAARRARPRLAEGPLREDAVHAPDAAQLRIFEVEAAHISTSPSPAYSESQAIALEPEWSSILLAAHPVSEAVASPEAPFSPTFVPQTAPLALRLMAAFVDGCIVMAAWLGFVAAFALSAAKITARLYPSPPIAVVSHPAIATLAIATAATLAIFLLLYQILFFTFSDATPGMRYAHIGLCTFSDENPTRRAMRRRIFAVLLAACPLGIGFVWAWLDEEGLGWHDRISRMYQRSY